MEIMVSEGDTREDLLREPHSKVLARTFSVVRSSCASMFRSRRKGVPGDIIIRVHRQPLVIGPGDDSAALINVDHSSPVVNNNQRLCNRILGNQHTDMESDEYMRDG